MVQPRDYYVIRDDMTNPAGCKIFVDDDGFRRISMTPAQARYWLDQNAISETQPKPKEPQE